METDHPFMQLLLLFLLFLLFLFWRKQWRKQGVVQTTRLTGNVYRILLKQPGTITATVEQRKKSIGRVRLSIKANLGQANPNVQKIGSDERLKVSYEVTQQEFNSNKDWYIIMENLSDKQILLNLTFNDSAQSQKEKLEPGLRICRHKEDNAGNKTIVRTKS